jgi:hypothetical protein
VVVLLQELEVKSFSNFTRQDIPQLAELSFLLNLRLSAIQFIQNFLLEVLVFLVNDIKSDLVSLKEVVRVNDFD